MAIFDFTSEQSSAIFSMDTARGSESNQIFIRYASNPDKEYIFTGSNEVVEELEQIAQAITQNNEDLSIGKTVHKMIREEKLVAYVE